MALSFVRDPDDDADSDGGLVVDADSDLAEELTVLFGLREASFVAAAEGIGSFDQEFSQLLTHESVIAGTRLVVLGVAFTDGPSARSWIRLIVQRVERLLTVALTSKWTGVAHQIG
jgi:hypothetical protein